MQIILVVVHLFLALGLIGLILIQHGKGADMGAAFGSGASATVFGAQGSASFLTRATAALATLFFLTSMALAYYAAQVRDETGIMESLQSGEAVKLEKTEVPTIPAAPTAVSDVPVATDAPVTTPAAPEAAAPAVETPSGTAAETEGKQ
jgi:preprotein translocase subunit SecG